MKNVSFIVDMVISGIEDEMFASGKHVIRTDTIRQRSMVSIRVDAGNDDTKYLAEIGFGQVVQSRLYSRGYRSVRCGMFVNVDRCEDIDYLQELLKNADINMADKERVRDRIKKLRDSKILGQIYFDIDGDIISGLVVPISEEELIGKLEEDAV